MLTSRVIPKLCQTVAVRNSSYYAGSAIAGPPTVRVSFAEKVALGMGMIGSFLVIPAWVLVHIEAYKGHE